MNVSRLALAATVACGLWAGNVQGQIGQPVPAQPTSYDYYYYQPESQPQQSATPVAYSTAAPDATCQATCDDGDSCGCGWLGCGWFSGCGPLCHLHWPCGCCLSDLGEPCKLWQPCCEDSPWTAGGWLAQSYTWNPYYPNDRFNGPVTWTDRANDYQMNELYGWIGKAATTDGCGWDWGFRTDALYGTNYRWDTSAGFETHTGNGTFYGLAVPQLYGEVAYNDLSVKVGRFFSPVGYYVIGTANNFFPVLPYTFQYGEPFTHTGALATYKYSDSVTLGGGVTHGWDSSDNTGNPHAGGLATATWAIDDSRSLAYVGVFGPEPNFSGVNPSTGPAPATGTGFTNRYLQTMVYISKLSDDVTWVLQSDFGTQHDAVIPGQTAKWYGLNSYLYWNMTCRLQWGLNGEWFRDQGGFRVGQVLPSFGSPNARGFDQDRGPNFQSPGFDGSFYRITFGPRYYFTPNIYTRAALLADWYEGKRDANTGDLPFDNGTRRYQQIVVFDLIATF
jgi:putative OmpL-like beta-barrel porin-2